MGNFIYKKSLYILLLGIIYLQGCAPLGETANSNNTRTYDRSFQEMTSVVKQALAAANLNIAHVDETSSGLLSIIVNRNSYVNTNTNQRDRGRVRVRNVDDNQTQVEVENPEYSASTPSSEKVNYHRIIFNRIDEQLRVND